MSLLSRLRIKIETKLSKHLFTMILILFVNIFMVLEVNTESTISSLKQQPKKILFWTTIYKNRSLDAWQHHAGVPRNTEICPFKCEYTVNMSELEKSDAVIYHGWPEYGGGHAMFPLPKPAFRNPKQVWVFLTREPAQMSYRIYGKLKDSYQFNWTMTFRTDSDIYFPYGRFERISTAQSPGIMDFIIDKAYSRSNHSLAAALISHCSTPSRRAQYIQELREIIPIDIYGRCGNLKCYSGADFRHSPYDSDCYKILGKKYKFWLSFENSLCPEYVTEKLYFPLKYGSLPVYLGFPEYPKNLPSHSYIHTKDFKNPKELGQYLLHLDSNPEEYLEYFQWRQTGRVTIDEEEPIVWCTLCQKLHKINPGNHMSYKSIADWFLRNNTQQNVCRDVNHKFGSQSKSKPKKFSRFRKKRSISKSSKKHKLKKKH